MRAGSAGGGLGRRGRRDHAEHVRHLLSDLAVLVLLHGCLGSTAIQYRALSSACVLRRVPASTQAVATFLAKADGVVAGLAVVDEARSFLKCQPPSTCKRTDLIALHLPCLTPLALGEDTLLCHKYFIFEPVCMVSSQVRMFGMQVFRCVDADLQTEWSVKDGDCIRRGDTFGRVRSCFWQFAGGTTAIAVQAHKHTGSACLQQNRGYTGESITRACYLGCSVSVCAEWSQPGASRGNVLKQGQCSAGAWSGAEPADGRAGGAQLPAAHVGYRHRHARHGQRRAGAAALPCCIRMQAATCTHLQLVDQPVHANHT